MRDRDEVIDRGWDRMEDGNPEEALEIAEALLAQDPDDVEGALLSGSALISLGEHADAERRIRRCLVLDPARAEAHLALGQLLYETCRFDEGLQSVEKVLSENPASSDTQYLAGLLLEMKGRRGDADDCFRRASELEPELYSMPASLDPEEFDRAVEEALSSLPAQFRESMENLAILVEDIPPRDLLESMDEPAPDLLGLFVGVPLSEKSHADVARLPERIYLFKRNLERACTDRETLVAEIRVTLLHEVGHYLGMDEEALREAGYA